MNRSAKRGLDDALALLGVLLTLPAMYFFTGSFLKYEMKLLSDVEILVPAPLVMIGGLLIAIILNVFSVLRIKASDIEGAGITKRLRSRITNAIVAGVAFLILSLLMGYVLLENLAEGEVIATYVDRYLHT